MFQRNPNALLLAFLLLGMSLMSSLVSINVARANDDDAAVADDTDSDVAVGELGTIDEDTEIPSPRRGRRAAPVQAPRVVVDPSVRGALAHRFSSEFSAEIYARGQLGAVADPLESRSSFFAGGVIANRSFGGLVWSNSLELSQHYRNFYDRLTYDGYELTTALARMVKLGNSAWTITPRASAGYQWTTDKRFERLKIEFMTPLTYKLTKQLDLIFTPKVDWQGYSDRPDNRRDVTGSFAAGVRYELAKGMSVAGSIAYETRSSNGRFGFTRLKLAPQLNLRKEL